ncbi:uncharacterized protein [Zea mays]|uniref:Uncharacterized protein n=1 Tax=Zea mays TaxID=4577 RepID=A0A1D6G7U7_MAIZE|nr:uncharacterized protein LOC103636442 isoform X2 [Zea mays]AQK99225.1 hypothetical protein ZEAMMB73_Zm00001d012258 [Zea mays]|eukprot:XP_008657020.1 uncharacterized protein LOC103636442 isoform X2 [Zea mays]
MDPDQVADAGVQHDDLGGSATSANGCFDGGSDDGWGRALLRLGWDLSRKAVIAGVAATAAPVVAPPLLVLSLAGLALSLPFAAYLASLAATDRLMGALLPAPRTTQPYCGCDLEDDEFLDPSEAPGAEATALDHWRDTEDDAIMEENESFVPLPLSRQPRFSEEPITSSSTDVEDKMAEGESLSRGLGHESLVLDNKEGTIMEDTEYITMEAPPRGSDVFGSAVPVLRGEDDMVQRAVEAPLTAKESVQELSVSDSEDRTQDDKCKDAESSKEILSLSVDITESSDFPVPGNEGIVVQRGNGETISVRKSGQDSHSTEIGDEMEGHKTEEEIPLHDANVSESSVLDDTVLEERKIEGDVTVGMAVKEVTIYTDPCTGEVAGDQVDSIAIALPAESELMQASNVDDVINAALTEGIVLDIGDTSTEGTEHYGEGGVSTAVSVVTVDDVAETVSSRSPAVSVIGDDMTSVKSRPDADSSDQTTGYDALRSKEFREKECVKTEESKTVPTESTSPPRIIQVSRSPAPDGQSRVEDEAAVGSVLEGAANNTDDLATPRAVVVALQSSISAGESEPPSASDRVEYKPANEGFRRNAIAEDTDNYTEEQMREQLDALRTITGYRPTPSLTLEAELVGLYVFVGVEPPVGSGSREDSDLSDLSAKLRLLKSIIGVE